MKATSASNFFPMPNKIFSLGLSAGEFAVYVYLMFCEDREKDDRYECIAKNQIYRVFGNKKGRSAGRKVPFATNGKITNHINKAKYIVYTVYFCVFDIFWVNLHFG